MICFLTIYKKKKKLLVSVNLKPHERRENKLFVFLSRWYVLIKHLSCAYTFFVFSRNVFFYADTKFSSHVLLSFNSLLFFKIMLNVDKKPLCGARKQRWLVSVAWKRKKKNPSNGSHPTTKKQRRRRRQKKSKQFFKKEIFLNSLTLWRSSCDADCVYLKEIFSLSLTCNVCCLNEFVYVGKWNKKKKKLRK